MKDLESTVAALAERVAALEAENARLRAEQPAGRTLQRGMHTPSRRSLLVAGAGMIGAFAGADFLTPGMIAAAPAVTPSQVVRADRIVAPLVLGTRVTVVPQRGGGYHWARYDWDMDGRFAGEAPPAVVAAVSDDYHGAGERAEPTVAVALTRVAGAWHATVLVNHIGHLATEVTLSAIALGLGE
jgi:hypothetical protein